MFHSNALKMFAAPLLIVAYGQFCVGCHSTAANLPAPAAQKEAPTPSSFFNSAPPATAEAKPQLAGNFLKLAPPAEAQKAKLSGVLTYTDSVDLVMRRDMATGQTVSLCEGQTAYRAANGETIVMRRQKGKYTYDLIIISADGNKVSNVTNIFQGNLVKYPIGDVVSASVRPILSPDGKYLAFKVDNKFYTEQMWKELAGATLVVSRSGAVKIMLSGDDPEDWTPDSRLILKDTTTGEINITSPISDKIRLSPLPRFRLLAIRKIVPIYGSALTENSWPSSGTTTFGSWILTEKMRGR